MPLRRAVLFVAALAAACAPTPALVDDDEPTRTPAPPTTTTAAPVLPTTTTTPGGPTLPTIPDFVPGPLDDSPSGPVDRVPGRAVLVDGRDGVIRTGLRTLDIEIGGFPTQPTWSRDGERIVMLAGEAPDFVVAIVDGDDGTVLGIPDANRPYFFFSWSHDGSRIAALGPGDGGTTLDILDADGNLLHGDVVSAASLWVAWDPGANRLAAHADERLVRIDDDAAVTDFGEVGLFFSAPKWIPGTEEILLVVDIEGTETLVRRGIEGGDTLAALGEIESEASIVVNPDGRTAAVTILFDVEGGGGAGERIALGPPPMQETGTRSGRVDIVDLATGERVPVFTGHALWVEWNPTGDRLLIGTTDVAANTGAWWVYEHDDPFADAADKVEPVVHGVVERYVPTSTFFGNYLVFADQYVEQPRLWSPAGEQFLYPIAAIDGEWVMAASVDGIRSADTIGRGAVGFWSPVE